MDKKNKTYFREMGKNSFQLIKVLSNNINTNNSNTTKNFLIVDYYLIEDDEIRVKKGEKFKDFSPSDVIRIRAIEDTSNSKLRKFIRLIFSAKNIKVNN